MWCVVLHAVTIPAFLSCPVCSRDIVRASKTTYDLWLFLGIFGVGYAVGYVWGYAVGYVSFWTVWEKKSRAYPALIWYHFRDKSADRIALVNRSSFWRIKPNRKDLPYFPEMISFTVLIKVILSYIYTLLSNLIYILSYFFDLISFSDSFSFYVFLVYVGVYTRVIPYLYIEGRYYGFGHSQYLYFHCNVECGLVPLAI